MGTFVRNRCTTLHCEKQTQNIGKMYKGAAKITCRRSRKGFSVRMNPDANLNNTVYQGLDTFQLKDCLNKVVLNRDDAAGFRLDTNYTHKQHKAVQLADDPDLTTRTDFVNSYQASYKLLRISSWKRIQHPRLVWG